LPRLPGAWLCLEAAHVPRAAGNPQQKADQQEWTRFGWSGLLPGSPLPDASEPDLPGEITHKDKSFPGQQPAIIEQGLWDRVQAQFEANLQGGRKRPRGTEKSLLAGLLYD